MVEEAELSGEDPAAERKRLRAARQKGAPGDTKAPEPTVPEATKDAEVPPAVESPQPAKTKFDAYVESAWGKKEPVSDSYRESQKQSINSISDYGIKMGRVIAFDRGDGSQELQFAAIAEELERRGYDVGPVRRSREGGVDNIEMSVAAKNPVPAAQEEANKEPTTQPPFAKTPEEIESLPTHSVYRSDFNGKPKFMVRGEGKRGGGDSMFDTQEEANKEAELAVSREKSRLEAKTKAAEKQAADQKAEEEHVASFQGFDAANPLKFGKARKSLEKQVNYQGKAQSRKQVVEQAVAEGAVVQNVVERAPLSNDRRKSLQQERLTESRNGRSPRFEELTQILDRGYEEVNTKRLVFPDERFLDEKAISSTGLRYAEHLAGLKKDPETADRDQFIARIKKNYGYKLTPREPKNADEQEQMDFLVSRGKKATFVDSDDRGFGGVVDHKTGHILIAGDRDTNDIWNAIGHELAHETGLDKIIPGDAAELSELKARRLQSTNNKFRKYLESNPEALDREARAEMVGQFMRDKGFRDQLARSNPTMWEAIRDAVLKLIGKWTPKNEAQALVLKELRQEKAPQVTETDQTGAKLDQTGAKSDQTGAKSDQTGAKSDQTGAKSDQTGAKSDQTGAAPGTPSEADFDAEAAKALDALDAQEKASKEKKPKSDGKPRAKRTGRKSDATKAEAQSDREAAKKAMAAAMAKLRGKVMMGVDPTIMAEIVQAAAMYVKADIKSFKGYVEALVEDFGDAWAKDFASYLESAWRVLHSRGRVDDPAGKIADFLTGEPKNEKQEESGAERDQRMGDGPGESQGDATATGDPVDGGRDAQGDPGQKGDALLPDSRKTEPDGGQRDSDGASADGDPDADQSDQGPTDATDSESGSDAGEMADRLAVNHVIAPDDDLAASGVVTSLNRNIKALELLKALETEGRFPDESERKALAQYTGWGGLSQALDSTKGERMLLEQSWGRDENWEKKWGKFYTQLKGLMSKEEFRAAQDSTENAHYTSKSVIQALWKIAERLGFNGGRVLELGAGVGHFAGLTPGRVRGATQFVMVEMDSISSRITKMLYPKHEVVSGDMQEFKTVPGSVTMGIGNVPFAPGSIPDAKARYGEELNLHNYSIARHLDAVAPGGIVVVISTHHTLDSRIKQRKFLATKGELIGAIRLPNDAFAENAKTEVVTDILIFRRPRQGDPSIGVRLDQNANITVKTKEGKEVEKSINKYFVDNPDMVLGVHSAKGSMRAADEYTVESTPGDLQEKLDAAISRLPMNILGKVDVSEQIVESTKNVPFGRLEVHNGKVVMGFGDNFVPIAGKTFEGFPSHLTGKTGVERAKDYVNLRESLTQVRKVMLSEDSTDADVKSEQQKLSKLYDGYVKKHGPLNSRKTNIFVRDPDYYRVLSLENEQGKYNPKTKKIDVTYEKSAIFETRVLGPRKEPQTADSTASAMSLSIAWRGAIDSAFIGKLLGVSSSDAENKLIEEGLAFRNPATTELDLADLYLSGNVRMKLAQAKLSAAEDAQYERNVEALTKVLPAEVPIRKDTVRLGATWVPEHIIQAFASKIFGTEASISYNSNSDSWTVEAYGISETAKARYKTDRVNPDKILEETLNLRSIKVYDRVETGEYDSRGKEKTTQVLNEKETQAAKHRASVMRADFEKWVMENEEVRQVLGAIYNDKYNNFVRTKYNGSALALPGANPTIKLRPYQMDAIWRIINRGTALLAHAVGSGKTFTMIGAAMEMRRLGLARRPLLVVQNATLGQFATSFQKMYPNANVLVASKGDLSAGNRQLFLNRVSTGNWDAVVMAQSTFDNMASDPEVERAFINDQIDLLEEAIREEGGEGAKTPTTKQLVRQRKSLKDRFDKLMGKRAKAGDNIVFEDLGADALFLDEAHAYKKPTFMTKLSSLVGLNTESSAKSLATTVKVRSIQAAHNGRNVILATGTPVTNTLGEAWHMVNYVSPATNEAFSSKTFDQFISNFAMVEPTLTMNAGGQYVYKDAIVKFRNGQQLVEYINDNWDIVTPDALRAYMSGKNESLPELRDGKLTAITVDRTPGVSEFMQFIESVYARFKSLPAKERRELSFIPAIAYGASKAATLDIRLVNPNAKEEPNSKLQRAAKEIKRIYDETSETKGTQLFFSDIKNPFSMTRLRQFMGGQVIDAFEEDTVADGQDADADTQNEVKEEDSFLYQELKRKLLESGIPAEQIALISDAKTDKQRESLFERVQSGDIRVLIGSTSKMGVGVNVQNKLAAIHHFDTPWLPADLEQREGRIIRFGNENKVVEILRYAMKKTLDGAIYMATSRKQKFIWQVLNGQLDGDSFDDPSSAAMLSIEEQLAAIQDDPIFFEKIETQNRLRELEMERQSFYDAQQRSRSTLNQYQSSLDYTKESSIHTRIQQFEEYKAAGIFDNFSLTIDGKTFTDAKEAAEIIKVKAEGIRKYVMENHDTAKSLSHIAGINDLNKNQIIQFQIGPAEITIGASPSVTDEINAEGNVVRTKSVSLKSEALIPSGLGRLYPFYSGTAVLPQTIFEKMGPLLEQSKDDLRAELNRVNFYTKSIEELKTLVDRQWEDQAEYDQKKERLSEIEQIMLASKSSLSSETKKEDEGELEKELRNRPPDPDILFQREEPGLMEQATNVVLDAEDLGLATYDELIAFAVKSIGERQTRFLGKYLQEAAKAGGMKGVRPTKEILGVPGVTKAEAVTFAKAAFPMLTDEMVETGMEMVDATAFGLEEIGFAPAGTPVPSGRMTQSGDQTNTPEFKRWFGDSKVVDADGKPLVVYHGTDADQPFNEFHSGQHFGGKVSANQRVSFRGGKDNSRIYPVYLSIKNPIRLSDRAAVDEASLLNAIIRGEVPGASVNVARKSGAYEAAKQAGYDGIVYRNLIEDAGKDSYVAFDPAQIKSATGNQGTFDPSDPSILKQNQEQNGNVKGWTKFISATRAIIGATDKADFSTFIHEFFHPMRRFLLDRSVPLDKRKGITDEDIQALEDYAGVKDGKWTVAAEEKAAKAWEQYWLEGWTGKLPAALQPLFEKIARWMRDVYQGVQQITGGQLTPEVRALFDKIVQRGFPDGFQMPPPHQGPGAPPVGSESHPEKLERIFPSRYEYTAMGKGVMNYLRELSNVPGLESNTKETVEGWVQQAEITLAADPYAAERLYRDVAASGGRPLDQHEVTLLAFHYRKLANDSEAAFQETVAAAESGDPARIAQARTDFIRTRQPMTEFEELTYASKSAMGRAFFALQVMLRQDFTTWRADEASPTGQPREPAVQRAKRRNASLGGRDRQTAKGSRPAPGQVRPRGSRDGVQEARRPGP
jgi:N12 class adenine-specific DNA methylase